MKKSGGHPSPRGILLDYDTLVRGMGDRVGSRPGVSQNAAGDALSALALQLAPFADARRHLFLGPCPPALIGAASLHGTVDVVDPDVARTKHIHQRVPSARIVRAPLAEALPRLATHYDTVFAVDPAAVSERWSWRETYDAIRRIGTDAATFLLQVEGSPAPTLGDVTAPATVSEFLEAGFVGPHDALAVEAMSPGTAVVYCPGDSCAETCAAVALARPDAHSTHPLAPTRALLARCRTAGLTLGADAAVVGHSVNRLPPAFVVRDRRVTALSLVQTHEGHGLSSEAGTPLACALLDRLLRDDLASARRLARQYVTLAETGASAPSLMSCAVHGESRLVSYVEPGPAAASASHELETFCQLVWAGTPRLAPRYPDPASVLRELLSPESPGLK